MVGVFIYALRHPETKEIRYIGQTNNIRRRTRDHLYNSLRLDHPVYRWIRKLMLCGLRPEMHPLFIVPEQGGDFFETRTIAYFRSYSPGRLLNVLDGGATSYVRLPRQKGWTRTAEDRERKRLGALERGRRERATGTNVRAPMKEETKLKISARVTGIVHSDQVRRNMSEGKARARKLRQEAALNLVLDA